MGTREGREGGGRGVGGEWEGGGVGGLPVHGLMPRPPPLLPCTNVCVCVCVEEG